MKKLLPLTLAWLLMYGLVVAAKAENLQKADLEDDTWVGTSSAIASTASSLPEELWGEVGITPFGHYFNNLDEYVSVSSGLLTVYQVDFPSPSNELSLGIARVYQTPSIMKGAPQPAIDLPGIEMFGKGWALDLPSVNSNYIRWWNGQLIKHPLKYDDDLSTSYIHKGGQHFYLKKFMDLVDLGGETGYVWRMDHWELTAADGTQARFNASGDPEKIWTPNGYTLTFTYANGLSEIRDSVGRTATFTYSSSGPIQSITISGPDSSTSRTVGYEYTDGLLTRVLDPVAVATGSNIGHETRFEYDQTNPYLLTKIKYPSGGASTYAYDRVSREFVENEEWVTYYKYRVRSHEREVVAGQPTQGDYWRLYSYVMRTTSGNWTRVASCTAETREKPDDPNPKLKEVFSMEDSEYSVVLSHTTHDPANNGKVLQRIDYNYNTNKEPTRQTVTRYSSATSLTGSVSTERVFDTWGNVVEAKDPYGSSTFTAYANGSGTGTSGAWTSPDFYANSMSSSIHNRPVGSYNFQDTAKTIRLETYHQYDATGNIIETKQRLADSAGTTWLKTGSRYTAASGLTYGPTQIVRGAHDPTNQVVSDITYDQYLAFPKKRTTVVESIVIDVSNLTRASDYPTVHEETFDVSMGKLASKKDANGNITNFEYDLLGRQTRVTYPQVTGETGRLATVLEYPVVNGVTSALTYHGTWDGQTVSSKNSFKLYLFDGLGRESEIRSYLSESDYASNNPESVRTVTYNWLGKIAKEEVIRSTTATLPQEQKYVTYYEYEPIGRLVKVINPDGTYISTEYDDAHDWTGSAGAPDGAADGSLKTVIDEGGHVKKYYYDWLDRLVMVREYTEIPSDPSTVVVETSYIYDAAGNLKQVTDGRGNWAKYDYDTLNRLTKVTYPIGNPVANTYDGLGRMETKTDQKGTMTTYTYDKLDRLCSVKQKPSGSTETVVASYEYDAAGNQVVATNGAVSTKRFPDEFNRVKQENTTVSGKTFTSFFRFDNFSRLKEIQYPSSKMTAYRYYGNGRVSLVQRGSPDGSPALATYGYYPMGLTSDVVFGNGVRTTYGLDVERPRIDKITTLSSLGQSLLEFTYVFESDGNIRSINADTFQYDGLGRLTSSTVR